VLRTHAATLFREVLKSANSGILAVVINYRYLAESKWLLSFYWHRIVHRQLETSSDSGFRFHGRAVRTEWWSRSSFMRF